MLSISESSAIFSVDFDFKAKAVDALGCWIMLLHRGPGVRGVIVSGSRFVLEDLREVFEN